jgi:hypothetical protein
MVTHTSGAVAVAVAVADIATMYISSRVIIIIAVWIHSHTTNRHISTSAE